MKSKSPYIFLILAVIFLLVIALLQSDEEQINNPQRTYKTTDKKEFGTYIFKNELNSFFHNNVIEVDAPIFDSEFNYEPLYHDENLFGDYCRIFLSKQLDFDSYEANKLIQMASAGDEILIISPQIGEELAEDLSISVDDIYYFNDTFDTYQFRNPRDSNKIFSKMQYFRNSEVSIFDTTRSIKILGIKNNSEPFFIKKDLGKGAIYWVSAIDFFTNSSLLDSVDGDFTSIVLSYLDPDKVPVWDNYYSDSNPINKDTKPLGTILSIPPLKRTFYILIILGICYLIFEGRRKQRTIPSIPIPKNTSVEFAETVGVLYFNQGDHKDLALKLFNYFTYLCRSKLKVRFDETRPEEFVNELSLTTNYKKERIKFIVDKYFQIKKNKEMNSFDLELFYKSIENFISINKLS